MTKNPTDGRKNTTRILSAGKIASAVLAVVGAGSAESFDDIDDHPASLDLRVRKRLFSRQILRQRPTIGLRAPFWLSLDRSPTTTTIWMTIPVAWT